MRPQRLVWKDLGPEARTRALERPRIDRRELRESVTEILERVRQEGDVAILEFTEQLDGARLDSFQVESTRIDSAETKCPQALMSAMRDAEQRIRAFHAADIPGGTVVETAPGLRCEVRYEAIDPVGLYVPGGSAPLVSTALMLGVPAALAGCERIVLCTPPNADGEIANEILAAAALCDIREVFAVGGAQAIAAMAYGTESVPRCSKIFGPGNAWVTEAKLQVSVDPDGAAIDMPAGPSEVLVIADGSADVTAIAWDLLSQAEHGSDSQVILLTDDDEFAVAVADLLPGLAATLPRAAILISSLEAARIITTDSLNQAIEISNAYAPEHLIINTGNARELADRARNAGSVFIGPWTPETLGDYCSGTNHVLPTFGWARSFGALSVADFIRRFTLQEANRDALRQVGPTAEALAEFEGLEAHRMAIRHRLESGVTP